MRSRIATGALWWLIPKVKMRGVAVMAVIRKSLYRKCKIIAFVEISFESMPLEKSGGAMRTAVVEAKNAVKSLVEIDAAVPIGRW